MPSADTLLPAPSTPSQPEPTPELIDLLDMLLEATQQADAWAAHKKALTETLTTLHDLGRITDKLDHRGWSVTYSPGRRTYEYPADVIELEAQLMELKEASVAAKRAILKPSNPFWTIRKPRPDKPEVIA